jgi:hypothetical protein
MSGSSAIAQGILAELLVVVLSATKAQSLAHAWIRYALIGVMFAYNSWSVVGGLITDGIKTTAAAQVAKQEVVELETLINQKDSLRAKFMDRDQVTLARKYEREITTLREKLSIARSAVLKNPAESLKINFFSFGIFRLIVMCCNSFLIANFSAFFRQRPALGLRLAYG